MRKRITRFLFLTFYFSWLIFAAAAAADLAMMPAGSAMWIGSDPLTARVTLAIWLFGVGTLLYRGRCIAPKVYGFLEIGAGLAIAYGLMGIGLGDLPAGMGAGMAEVGALYIIVRGYDNIYRGLTSKSVLRLWNRFFFEQDTDAKQ